MSEIRQNSVGHSNYEETLPKTTCEKEKVEIKQKEKVTHTPRAIVRHENSSEKKKIQSLRLYKEIVKKREAYRPMQIVHHYQK